VNQVAPEELKAAEIEQADKAKDRRIAELEALLVKEGPLNAERWALDKLLEQLEQWKRIASGRTCVSFENLCFGASSLWHQTHRENFRAIDRKPDELSRWVLEHERCVMQDFPAQVLEVLERLRLRIVELEHGVVVERIERAKPIDDAWSCQEMGGSYKYDANGEIEDCSFIGWDLSRGSEGGPSVAYYVEDGQLFLDGYGVPGVFVKTRGDLIDILAPLRVKRKGA
jgi:hypothetical protein